MANMELLINNFLITNEIDESAKDSLVDLINGCFTSYVTHMSSEWSTIPAKKPSTKVSKKTDKTEDPTECKSEEELTLRCTSTVLDGYCRTHKLRIGGEGGKATRVGRVWRHMSGKNDENDTSPRSKAKATPAKKEPHRCVCLTSKNLPCGSAATNENGGHWFCYKHIDTADEWLSCFNKIENKPSPAKNKKKVVELDLNELE